MKRNRLIPVKYTTIRVFIQFLYSSLTNKGSGTRNKKMKNLVFIPKNIKKILRNE